MDKGKNNPKHELEKLLARGNLRKNEPKMTVSRGGHPRTDESSSSQTKPREKKRLTSSEDNDSGNGGEKAKPSGHKAHGRTVDGIGHPPAARAGDSAAPLQRTDKNVPPKLSKSDRIEKEGEGGGVGAPKAKPNVPIAQAPGRPDKTVLQREGTTLGPPPREASASPASDCAPPPAKFSKLDLDKRIAEEEAKMVSMPEMAAEEPEFNVETGLTSTRYMKLGWTNFVMPRLRCICVNKRAFITLGQIEGLSVTVCFSRYGGLTLSVHAWPDNRARLNMVSIGEVIEFRNLVCREQPKRDRKDWYGDFSFVGLFNANSLVFTVLGRNFAGPPAGSAPPPFGQSCSTPAAHAENNGLLQLALEPMFVQPDLAPFEVLDEGGPALNMAWGQNDNDVEDNNNNNNNAEAVVGAPITVQAPVSPAALKANVKEGADTPPPGLQGPELIELADDDDDNGAEDGVTDFAGELEDGQKSPAGRVNADDEEGDGVDQGGSVRRQPLREGGEMMRARLRLLARHFLSEETTLEVERRRPRQRLQRGDSKFYVGELELEDEIRAEAGFAPEDSAFDEENALAEPEQLRLLSQACVMSAIPEGEQTELDENNEMNLRCPFCADFMLNDQIVFLQCLHFIHLPCAWRMFRRQQFCPFCNRHVISGHTRQATTTSNCAVGLSSDGGDVNDGDDEEQRPCTSETAMRRRS